MYSIIKTLLAFVLLILSSSLYSQNQVEIEELEENETNEILRKSIYPAQDPNYKINSTQSVLKTSSTASINNSSGWIELGPQTNTNHGIGRVSSMAFGNTEQEIYIGTSYGGVWKTNDGGANFSPLLAGQQLPVLAITDIQLDNTTNSNYLYIATGEENYFGVIGSHGIYRCNPDGTNLVNITTTGFPTTYYSIESLFLYNSNILFAATSNGIYRTNNATSVNPTWIKVYSNNYVRNIIKDPSNANILYASGTDILKSTDYGVTWNSMIGSGTGLDFSSIDFTSRLGGASVGAKRISITKSPIGSQSLYANVFYTSDPDFTWSTTQYWLLFKYNSFSGQWINIGERPLYVINGKSELRDRLRPMTEIIASPIDSNVIFMGRICLSKYNGNTFTNITQNLNIPDYYHADILKMKFSPFDSNKLFICNDGNLNLFNVSTNSFVQMKNHGLSNATIYGVSYNPMDERMTVISMQDNGTSQLINQGAPNYYWWTIDGGDGLNNYIQFNYSNNRPIIWYRKNDGNLVTRFEIGGNRVSVPVSNFDGHEPTWYFTKIKPDPQDPSVIYMSGRNMWKFTNYGTPAPSITPTAISKFSYYSGSTFLSDYNIGEWQVLNHYAIAPSNNKVIYAAFDFDTPRLFKTIKGGGTATTDWTEITIPQPQNTTPLNLSDITVSPFDENTIFVTYTGYNSNYRVKKYNGTTWSDYNNSAAIPNDRQINCILYEKGSLDGIYIGTDIGVYYTNRFMNNWSYLDVDGFPNVIVNELAFAPNNRYLYAGTYGRGLWGTTLACPTSNPITLPGAPIPPNNFYETNSTIVSSATVPAPKTVFKAGSSITLNPGFIGDASQSVSLFAYVYKCTGGTNLLSNNLQLKRGYEGFDEDAEEVQAYSETKDSDELIVYPVPSTGPVTIKTNLKDKKAKELDIYSITGKKIKELNPSIKEQSVNLSDSNERIFIIRLITDKGIIERKIMINSKTDTNENENSLKRKR